MQQINLTEMLQREYPESYGLEVINTGRIERLNYKTKSYDCRDLSLQKSLNIYLPEGYDASNQAVKYDILYLMHGGGEDQDTLFGGPSQNTELKNIIDHCIKDQLIQPMIIVTPSFYNEGNQDMSFMAQNFYQELVNDIIPIVESKYHTYAKNICKEELIRTRDHRAFGGFSMGSACTWSVLMHSLEYFRYFMPLSGDCWAIEDKGGLEKPTETAELLANAIKGQGYTKDDYYIFCATGDEDIAYPNLTPQIEAMKLLTDQFAYTENGIDGNFAYFILSDENY